MKRYYFQNSALCGNCNGAGLQGYMDYCRACNGTGIETFRQYLEHQRGDLITLHMTYYQSVNLLK